MIYCYPVASKRKSLDICAAFAAGCGGRIATELHDGDAFFYGVDESNLSIWRTVLADESRTFYYCDNAYFDSVRQQYFRVTKNRMQHSGLGSSTSKRFEHLGINIRPWAPMPQGTIVVIQQSDPFMHMVGSPAWFPSTVRAIEHLSNKHVEIRLWNRDKRQAEATIEQTLAGAHGLVTWSSAAAITAVLYGKPVVTMGQCAAEPFSSSLLAVDDLPIPDVDRHNWARVLADNQWTLEEMKSGLTWRMLNEGL